MGCFSLPKSKRKDRFRLPPASQSQSVMIYENKPIALPDPLEVESGRYGRNLSAPPSFEDKSQSQACASPRAQSAPPGFTIGNNEANYIKSLAKQANRFKDLCSRRVCRAPNQRHRSDLWHSGPLDDSCNRILASSFRHSGPLSTSSSSADSTIATSQSCRYGAVGGRFLHLIPPQPLPLPLPQDVSLQSPQERDVTSASSLASSPSDSNICVGSNHSPPDQNKLLHSKPLPTPEVTNACVLRLRYFSFEELVARCMNFSSECCIGESCSGSMYRTWIDERSSIDIKQKTQVAVVRLQEQWCQDDKEFVADVTSLAEARDSHLCALIGFSIERNMSLIDNKAAGRKRLLVYEHLPNGSLDRHLYGQEDSPPLDWFARMKVALDAAGGLMELHNKFLDQALYCDFRPLYIQLNSDFSAKLTGYGLRRNVDSLAEIKDLSKISAYLAPETAEKGELSVRSNVWSFGVVLLEFLTGRQHGGGILSSEERDLVKWCTSYLRDSAKLFLIIDPKLEGRYPAKDAKIVCNLALHCLQRDPHLRPNIYSVVEVLKSLQWLMPTPVNPIKHEPAECIKRSLGSKSSRSLKQALHDRSLKQALHERDPEHDLSTLFSSTDAICDPVKLHRQLQEKLTTSILKRLASSKPSISCSSSFAQLKTKQNEIIYQVQASQTR